MQNGSSRYARSSTMNRPNASRKGSNVKFFYPTSKAEAISPVWDGKMTCVRPFPTVNPDGGFEPYMFEDGSGFSRWLEFHFIANKIGQNLSSWILYDSEDPTYDQSTNPYRIISDEVSLAVKANALETYKWAILNGLTQENWSRRFVKWPREAAFMQCAVYQLGDESYSPPKGSVPDGPLPVLVMSSTAVDALFARMEEYGDPVGLDSGGFVILYQEGTNPLRRATGGGFGAKPTTPRAGISRPSAGKAGFAYDCTIEREFMGQSPVLSEFSESISRIVKPWIEILEFPDNKRQVEYLCRAFRPQLILDVLGPIYGDYIPEWVAPAAVEREVADVTHEVPREPAPQPTRAAQSFGRPSGQAARPQPANTRVDSTVSDEDLPHDSGDDFAAIEPPYSGFGQGNETFDDNHPAIEEPPAVAAAKARSRQRRANLGG